MVGQRLPLASNAFGGPLLFEFPSVSVTQQPILAFPEDCVPLLQFGQGLGIAA